MHKLEIQSLLSEISESLFLDKIEMIKDNEKQYKKSEFYKKTRIPLLQLVQMYEVYHKNKYGITEGLNLAILSIDEDMAMRKFEQILKKVEEAGMLENLFEKIQDMFSPDKLTKNLEELKVSIQNLKK